MFLEVTSNVVKSGTSRRGLFVLYERLLVDLKIFEFYYLGRCL